MGGERFKGVLLSVLIVAFLIVPLLLISAGTALGGDVEWVRQFGSSGNNNDYAYDVAVDAAGNVYVAGKTFGMLPEQTDVSWGGDAFVRKYDGEGNEIWTKEFGTSGGDYADCVAVDASGNVYVAGETEGALPGQSSSGYYDAFVRRYDGFGNELWTRQFGSSTDDYAWGVAVDASGNIYVAGETYGALPGQTWLGGEDAFVRKYDDFGNEIWTRQFGSSGGDFARGVAVDASGNVYVAGYTGGALPGQTSSGGDDVFIMKLGEVAPGEEMQVGFKAGDWIKYDYAISGAPPGTPLPQWIKVEFLSVEGTAVSVRATMHMPDGTEPSETMTIDVATGEGTFGGLSGFAIPANSKAGDSINLIGYGTLTIAGETTRTYAGASRTVLHASISQYGAQLTFYWDKQAGVMVEASGTSDGMTVTAKVTETNMWQAGPSAPTNWPLIAGVIGVIVVIGIVAVVYMKRR